MERVKVESSQLARYLKELSASEVIKCLISGIVGVSICIFTSAIVNTTLVEISINIVFAFYFGLCFLVIGVLMIARIESLPEANEVGKQKPFLFIFSLMVIASGVFCFFLEEHWFVKLTPREKGPIYTMISISLTFCIVFSIIDIVNFVLGFCQKAHQKTIVETPKQIVISLVLSALLGLFYGIVFSILDLEEERGWKLNADLIQDEYFCIPIATILGFVGGFANELLRIKGDYLPFVFSKQEDPFNQEI